LLIIAPFPAPDAEARRQISLDRTRSAFVWIYDGQRGRGLSIYFCRTDKDHSGLCERAFATTLCDVRVRLCAPVGFNLAVANPDSITAIVSQNGNAYEEGLGAAAWAPLRAYWTQPSPVIREAFKERMSLDGVREAYFQGVSDPVTIEPEAYWLDAALLGRPGMMDIQADLKLDYKYNIERYPLYQQYLRTHQPPLLAMWGKNDSFFIPPGAEAFKRDVPNADVRFVDAGHFALETNVDDFASAIMEMTVNA
jgi:pimeloyl-ACP methyl ester carboxylesterase